MKIKKFGKIALATAITFGGIGTQLIPSKAFAASVSNNGISANPIHDMFKTGWYGYSPQVAVKNDNSWPVNVTVTLQGDDYTVNHQLADYSNPVTITLQPEEKKYVSIGDITPIEANSNLGFCFKINSVKYDGKDLGTFYTTGFVVFP